MDDWLKFLAPFVVGGIAWIANENIKRAELLRQRKEESYRKIIGSLRAFSFGSFDPIKVNEALAEMDLLWLYASDEVIRSAYAFVASVGKNAPPRGWIQLSLKS